MTPEERNRMNSLCIGIQEETDYKKFVAMLHEMSELIARKERRRFHQFPALVWQRNKPWKTVPAKVNKVVKPYTAGEPDRVEIGVVEGEDLFREIRIENSFMDVDGTPMSLQTGTELELTFEAETKRATEENI